MALRWTDIMRIGSFDGIEFPIQVISEDGGRVLALHTYPDVPGQEVEDQGRAAATWDITATWSPDFAELYGNDIYPGGMNDLKARLQEGGSGIFVHPLWGEATVAVSSWSFTDDASRPDVTIATMTFVEDSLEPFSLEQSTTWMRVVDAEKKSELIDTALVASGEFSTNVFAEFLADFKLVLYAVNATRYAVESKLLQIRADIRSLVDGSIFLNNPVNWSVMELIIGYQADLTDMVSAVERDRPMFDTYTVRGDTDLMTLAVQLNGSTSFYDELLSLNSAVIGNPQRIKQGTDIVYRVQT
jgi:hypothetical protein